MYHPSLGRFLQTDPTGFDAGDMNLFRYCGDDPVDRSDPTGLDAISFLWKLERHFDSSNTRQDSWSDLNRSGPSTSLDAGSIYMRRADAMARYGPYKDGKWAGKEGSIIEYRVPESVLHDPNYHWHWDKDLGGGRVTHFPVNKDIAPSITRALKALQRSGHVGDLDTFSGGYVPRTTRGSSQISAHAYGLALDINSESNPRGMSPSRQPLALRVSFMREGFVDGGTWTLPFSRPDPMHFTVGF
jgi:hypothetical protein